MANYIKIKRLGLVGLIIRMGDEMMPIKGSYLVNFII